MNACPRGILLAGTFVLGLSLLASCGSGKGFKPRPKPKPTISHYEIYQPDSTYAQDDVILWQSPACAARAFLLPPGTKVEVLETVDDKEGKTFYKVKAGGDRTAWVPKSHCKAVYK